MKNYCKSCGVTVDGRMKNCPLCGEYVSEPEIRRESAYPDYEMATKKKLDFVTRLLIFLSIVAVSVCALINYLTWSGVAWSVFVLAGILYLWLLVANTVMSKASVGSKILFQLLIMSGCVYAIERFLSGGHWALEYVVPFMTTAATLIIAVFSLAKSTQWREYIIYLMMITFFGFIPLVLFAFGIADVVWPSAASALFSFIILMGTIIFADHRLKNEVKKRFHL